MTKKTLIVYHFHEQNDNTDFFIRNALSDSPNIDYILTINNPAFENQNYLKLEAEYPNKVKIMRRENKGFDYGGYGHALFKSDWENYDYFVFINSSCKGPFLPSYWPQDKHWSEAFTDKINDEVKLVGPEIYLNWRARMKFARAFLGGYCFATDKVGVEIGIKKGVFQESLTMHRSKVVYSCEVGLSNYIINAGHNIAALASHAQNIDFRKQKEAAEKIWERRVHLYLDKHGKSCGASTMKLGKCSKKKPPYPHDWEPASAHTCCLEQYVHPYEVVFSKVGRDAKKGDKARRKTGQKPLGSIGALEVTNDFSDWHDKKRV